MAYRAAVFDLDGTLLNTLADLADSGNELLASYGMAPHPEPAFRYFVGNGSRKLMERILPGKSPEQIDEALARYKAIYEKHLTAKTRAIVRACPESRTRLMCGSYWRKWASCRKKRFI